MYKGGFGMGGGNMQNLLKQAQKLQAQMQEQQEQSEEKLKDTLITASSGGGMVNIEITGKREIKSLKINPSVVDNDDVEMLEDLIVACITDALRKVEELETELKPNNLGGMF